MGDERLTVLASDGAAASARLVYQLAQAEACDGHAFGIALQDILVNRLHDYKGASRTKIHISIGQPIQSSKRIS